MCRNPLAETWAAGSRGDKRSVQRARHVFWLPRCPATDETAAALSGLAQMQALDLRFCAITNTGMQALSAGMPALRRVVIDGCPLTSLGVWRLLMAHKRLCLWSPGEAASHL